MISLSGHLQVTRGFFSLDTELQVPGQGITTISGRSGAGKTTLLRCIAGLENSTRGKLTLGDDVWLDSARNLATPAEQRGVGLVSQDAYLFAHLNVRENLSYGLKRIRNRPQRVRFETVVETLLLTDLLDREVEYLSGGERRRVAIGRALLSSPRVLLLDEPVSALDSIGRREVLDGIQAALNALAIPCLYVSHDLQEAARLADHMLWMETGRVVAAGPIGAVLCDLQLPFAQAMDSIAVIDAVVESHDVQVHLTRLSFVGGELWVATEPKPLQSKVRIQIGARDVSLARVRPENTSVLNVIDCKVDGISAVHDSPAHALVRLSASGVSLLARITWKSAADLDITPGERMWAMVKSVAVLS